MNVHLDSDDVMVSFDVVSMFTCIPFDLAIDCVLEKWEKIKFHTGLDRNTFARVLKFCLTSSYCSFQGKFYFQIEGLPMDSPLSAMVSEIVLDNYFTALRLIFRTLNF